MSIIQVKVKPNAQQQSIKQESDGSFKVNLKSSPIEGKANQELIKLLADYFHISKSQVVIKSGLTSRHKLVELLLE